MIRRILATAATEARIAARNRWIAISVALIVVELITNCAKYGYPNGTTGKIWVGIARNGDGNILISVRDEGVGLPTDFDPGKSRGLGMRIVNAFANQLNTKLAFTRHSPGSEFKLLFPIDAVQR